MKSQILAQGAEAIILNYKRKNWVFKDRIPKSYRIPELDNKIRTKRTRSEAKLLLKASQIINAPIPEKEYSQQEHFRITMPFINGKKLSEHLDNFPLSKQKQILKQIGKDIAKLHNKNIIHGDLTTSNMIYVPDKKTSNLFINNKTQGVVQLTTRGDGWGLGGKNNPVIFFIDFGLGYFNGKYEDKAVDIHLLKQALEAKHFKHWEKLYKEFEKGYKDYKEAKKVFQRLKTVEKRGRYKHS